MLSDLAESEAKCVINNPKWSGQTQDCHMDGLSELHNNSLSRNVHVFAEQPLDGNWT